MILRRNTSLSKLIFLCIVFVLLFSSFHFSFGNNQTDYSSIKDDGTITNNNNTPIHINKITYVSPYGNNTQNGNSWNHSIQSIRKAINITCENGTIILDEGTYYVSYPITRNIHFKAAGRQTVLKGDGATLFRIDRDVYASFEGITFKDNTAKTGGAIYNLGFVRCQDCLFENCSAELGGVIFNAGDCGVANCVFRGNIADHGGVIYSEGNTKITSSYFKGNTAGTGAIIHINNNKHTLIQFCELQNNTANKGNLIYAQENLKNPDIIFDSNHYTFDNNNFIGRIQTNNALALSRNVKINLQPITTLYGYKFNIPAVITGELHPQLQIPLTGVPVQFFVDGQCVGTAEADDEGNINLKNIDMHLKPGEHELKAVFAGNNELTYCIAKTQLKVLDWIGSHYNSQNKPNTLYYPLIHEGNTGNNSTIPTTPDIEGIIAEIVVYAIFSNLILILILIIIYHIQKKRRRKD